MRLLKIGPRNTTSLIEQYFYGFAVIICVAVMILGKAGGLSGYDAVVTGLWVGGFLWFAWLYRGYLKERGKTRANEKSGQAAQALAQMTAQQQPSNMKPMIGPQWPMKKAPQSARPARGPFRPAQLPMKPAQTQTPAPGPAPASSTSEAPSKPNKPAFVYERPTLPDRKPKLPNNWTGRQGKKPKR